MKEAIKRKNEKIGTVMHEFKVDNLKSSSGDKVTNKAQALAIAMSEAKRLGMHKYKKQEGV